jgi:hypothetical protein
MTVSRRTTLAAVAVLAAAAAVGAGIAVALGRDDHDQPITGAALERASAAALAHTGGGTVTDSEAGDEEGAYEIEVTLADGTQVDVHLDDAFNVIGEEREGPGEDDDEGGREASDD